MSEQKKQDDLDHQKVSWAVSLVEVPFKISWLKWPELYFWKVGVCLVVVGGFHTWFHQRRQTELTKRVVGQKGGFNLIRDPGEMTSLRWRPALVCFSVSPAIVIKIGLFTCRKQVWSAASTSAAVKNWTMTFKLDVWTCPLTVSVTALMVFVWS